MISTSSNITPEAEVERHPHIWVDDLKFLYFDQQLSLITIALASDPGLGEEGIVISSWYPLPT
jgi:hypothetical protein